MNGTYPTVEEQMKLGHSRTVCANEYDAMRTRKDSILMKTEIVGHLKAIQMLAESFKNKSDFYRDSTYDPHHINTALYAAMCECEAACRETIARLNPPDHALSNIKPAFKHYAGCPAIKGKPVCTCGSGRAS